MSERKDILKLLADLKVEIRVILENKLIRILLFGSYSRGDFSASSDVDLMILVDGDLSREEREQIDDVIAEYSLEHDIVISGIVYPSKIFREYNTPFLLNVKEDGIKI